MNSLVFDNAIIDRTPAGGIELRASGREILYNRRGAPELAPNQAGGVLLRLDAAQVARLKKWLIEFPA
jgi:hypothetical protein